MPKSDHLVYRPDIDGLRAVAVLAVVFCHANLGFPGGYVGVDVFFVISGYLITGLILKALRQGTFSLADFWERRVRRIVPALVVMSAATMVLGWFLLLPSAFEAVGKSVIGVVALVSNVQFWRETGYFAAAAEQKPLLHTWSLAVEEQFYLFVPLLLWGLGKAGRLSWVAFLFGLMGVASFALSVWGVANSPSATFYLLPTRAWELIAGSLLAITTEKRTALSGLSAHVAGVTGLTLILGASVLYTAETRFPGFTALPPVIGAVLLIVAGPGSVAGRLLSMKPVVFVGLISYSLYLWHWPLLAFARHRAFGQPLSLTARLALVAMGLLLGVLSWRLVERPFRNRRMFGSRRTVMTAAFCSSALLLVGGGAAFLTHGFDSRLPPDARLMAKTSRNDERYFANLETEDIPNGMLRLGSDDAPAELLVWGDSHAMHILPAVESLCREQGVAGYAATHSLTAPVLGYFKAKRGSGMNEHALPFNEAVFRYIRQNRIRHVILAAWWSTYFPDPGFRDALLRTISLLQEEGAQVYFVKSVPVYDQFDVPSALVFYRWMGLDTDNFGQSRKEYEVVNRFHVGMLPELAVRGVRIIDAAAPLISPTAPDIFRTCDEQGSYYFDQGHLSTHGALAVTPAFCDTLAIIGREIH